MRDSQKLLTRIKVVWEQTQAALYVDAVRVTQV